MDQPVRPWAELGERQATSGGERMAAKWLAAELERAQIQVWQEPFISFLHPRRAWVLLLSLSLLSGLLAWTHPGAGLLLSLVAALGGGAQALGWWELGWLLGKGESQNVVGVVSSTEQVRSRVVVVAHYDTYPCCWSRPAFMGALGIMLLLPLALAAWAWAPGHASGGLAGALVLGGGIGLADLLRTGQRRSNDAGVAAGLAVANWEPLRHTEVWTLFTGSRGPGMVGLGAFLLRYGKLLEDASFVVLEGAENRPSYYRSEVALLRQRGHRVTGVTLGPQDMSRVVEGVRTLAEGLDKAAEGLDKAAEGP